jgi:hypothetical protein
MTPLTKSVRRAIPDGRRGLVVSLIPNPGGPLLEIREKGRRKGFAAPISRLYVMLARLEADRLMAEKRAARKARKAGKA